MLDEFKNIKSGRKELREFGFTIGIILFILGGISAWRGRPSCPYLFGAGIIFAAAGLIAPGILKFLQKAWMALAVVLGFIMSRVILVLFFYAVITPMGLFVKLLGKDILDQRIDRSKASYWMPRPEESRTKASYENQY